MGEREGESRMERVNAGGGERVEECKREWPEGIASQGKGRRVEEREGTLRGVTKREAAEGRTRRCRRPKLQAV